MKLGIKGYQSIRKAVLDINPGEVVGVVGANNFGKSAIVRAIHAFITNAPSKDVINSDLGGITVAVKTDRGLFIWEKTDKSSSYTVNGKKEIKLNKATLDEIYPKSGFVVEKEDGTYLVPAVVPENELMFPFSLTPSVAFRIFSRFMAPPKIGIVVKDLKERVKEDRGLLVAVRGSIDAYETEVSRNVGELEKLPKKEELRALRQKAEKASIVSVKMENIETRLNEKSIEYENLVGRLASCDVNSLVGLKKKVDGAQELINDLAFWDVKIGVAELLIAEKETQIARIRVLEKVVEVKEKVEKAIEWETMFVRFDISVKFLGEIEEDLKHYGVKLEVSQNAIRKFKVCPLCERTF